MVKSKQRIRDHGEVYTPEWLVNDMLDLVKDETERIDSRFLEPACGDGNFLAEILRRKLNIVQSRYGKSQTDYERYAVLAITSIYGIDILEDNVQECRNRLLGIFDECYSNLYGDSCKPKCRDAVAYILSLNIIHGDALSLTNTNGSPITFAEWSAVNGSMLKRRDFTFRGLLEHGDMAGMPLFSDLGEDVFLPEPTKDYPLADFLSLSGMRPQEDKKDWQ
jgi:SAM-dependent methyltransferase